MTETGLRQHLVAILAADAAGFSRLMAADERATVAALDAARAVFRSQIEANQGRVIDMAGDSVLAVFETATGAVSAALAVQRDLNASGGDVPQDRQMRFRIGVHLGDVIEKGDGTVYGDGVNIAARLQALAEVGGITVSDAVQGAVRGKTPVSFVDQGEQTVKNISHPVRAFAARSIDGDARPGSAAVEIDLRLPEKPSIAVLPFANMSGDPEQDYFADGMVEDIITALARMGVFFVIARNSSFVYKGKAVDIKQVGRELGVRYVLEGSVRRSANRVRITSQLIEADNGRHVWADRFEGSFEDVFELQDRITESIVAAIEPNMLRAEIERTRIKPASNLQAYDLVLRAYSGVWPGATRVENDAALSCIRRALEMDPRYSFAKAMAAWLCFLRITEGYGDADDVRAGLRYAEEALSEDNTNAYVLCAGLPLASLGYRALGFRLLGFRYDEGQRAVERALNLSPNLLVVQLSAATLKLCLGESDMALEHLARAMRISPIDPGMSGYVALAGSAHLMSGRYEEALLWVQRAIQASPRFALGHRILVAVLFCLDRIDEAKLAAQRLLELAPGFTVSRFLNVAPFKDAEYRKLLAEAYRAAGIPK